MIDDKSSSNNRSLLRLHNNPSLGEGVYLNGDLRINMFSFVTVKGKAHAPLVPESEEAKWRRTSENVQKNRNEARGRPCICINATPHGTKYRAVF